jgi:hypothetical protein
MASLECTPVRMEIRIFGAEIFAGGSIKSSRTKLRLTLRQRDGPSAIIKAAPGLLRVAPRPLLGDDGLRPSVRGVGPGKIAAG